MGLAVRYRKLGLVDRSERFYSEGSSRQLDGSTVEGPEQSESRQHDEGHVEAFFLTQIVRNPSGEYF